MCIRDRPILFEERFDEREAVGGELLVLRGVGIIEGPLSEGNISVSYTHLDVYKRQDFNMYCELYCFGEDNASEEMLKTYLSEYHFRDFIMMDTKWTKGRPTLLLTMTNLKGELGESSAMIGLWLDQMCIRDRNSSLA